MTSPLVSEGLTASAWATPATVAANYNIDAILISDF